ncbi:MAG TPA: hypothetical protein VFU19_13565 [Iamia sp.]|nr:hypothetical protein [Iamia sp.]
MRTHQEIVQRHLVTALEANQQHIARHLQRVPATVGPTGEVDVDIDLSVVVDVLAKAVVRQIAPLVAAAGAVTTAQAGDLDIALADLESALTALGAQP